LWPTTDPCTNATELATASEALAELKLSMERFISTMRRLVEALREADTFSTA
jgi:hypothetical protein